MTGRPTLGLAAPTRLAAVEATGLLDAPAEEAFDRLARMASALVQAPIAVIALVTDQRHVIVSQVGLAPPGTAKPVLPLDLAPCKLVVEDQAPLVVRDLRADARPMLANAATQAGIASYAGVPLRTRDGIVIGSIAVIDGSPREWTAADLDWLTQISAAATDELELRAAHQGAEDRATEALAVASQLRSVHDLLTRLAAQVPGIIYQFRHHPDGHYSFPYASAAMRQIYGVRPEAVRDDAAAVFAVLAPEDLDEINATITRSRETLTRWQLDYRIHHPERGVRWLRGDAIPERLEDGSTLWHGYITDITAEVTARQEREELELQLGHAQKMEAIGTLAGGIAHDFNNVLTGILGNVQAAEGELSADHAAREPLEDAMRAARRAKALVAQILDFSRRRPPARVPTPLWPVLEEAWRLVRASLPATISMDAVVAPGTESASVFGDPTQLHQVIVNLCTNAASAMHGGPGTLSLRLERVMMADGDAETIEPLPAGPYLRIDVRDTGIGMDEATRQRIFEPFFTTRPTGEGTGLGLTMVYAIVKSHEGGVAVLSAPGAGTTMQIYLPEAVTAVQAGHGGSPARAAGAGPPSARLRVMVVDDEAMVGKAARRLLQRFGHEVQTFLRAREALEAFAAAPDSVDLVLTDLTMPEMDGAELAGALRRLRPDLPIVLCSGLLNDEARRRLSALGGLVLLEKPYTLDDLADALTRALEAVGGLTAPTPPRP